MRKPSIKVLAGPQDKVRLGGLRPEIVPRLSPSTLAGLILAATLVSYLPVFQAGFIWDDDRYVTQNLTLRSLEGLHQIWFKIGAVPQYYPLVHATFWLEYHLWGLHPAGYHVVNVLLHGLAAILLGRVLTRLQVPGAWLAAALFALHPVQVESVAWVTERKNVLSAVFYFAAALAYLRWAGQNEARRGQRSEVRGHKVEESSSWRFYVLALSFFVLALLSKTVTCSLPAALLVVLWWKHGQLRWVDFAWLAPFLALGAGAGLLTTWMERQVVGAHGADWSLTFAERCLVGGRAFWFYASKLAWPANLTFIYPRWEVSTAVWWQWAFPLAALGIVVSLWLVRGRLGRGPLAAALFFSGTLSPALGFINTYPMRYSFVADHFQYLASIGLLALGAGAWSWLAGQAAAAGPWSHAWRVVSAFVLLVLGTLTWRQTTIYHDRETLWRDTLAKNQTCTMAHNNLGFELASQGRAQEAEVQYREAVRLKPADLESLNNLGVALADEGQFDQAVELLRRALQFGPNNAKLLSDLAKALAGRGDHTQALACFERALRLEPGEAEHYYNLGTELAGLGRADEAIRYYRQALQHNPKHVKAHINLGLALAGQGQVKEAMEQYNEALRLAPGDALTHNNLGTVLLAQGDLALAVGHFRQAIRAKPDYANAHFNLARALAAQRKSDEAIVQYDETLRLSPGNVEAQNSLAVLLLADGRSEEAVRHCEESLRLQPRQAAAHLNLGNAFALQRKYEEAVGQFSIAAQLAPDNAQAHRNLGLALLRVGRREEAAAQLQQALRLNPDFEEAKQQLRALESSR